MFCNWIESFPRVRALRTISFLKIKREKEEKTTVTSRRAASFVAFQLISSRLHIFVACVFSSRQEADHPQLCTWYSLSLSHVTLKKSKKSTNRRTNKIPRTNLEFHQSEKRRVFSNPDKSRKDEEVEDSGRDGTLSAVMGHAVPVFIFPFYLVVVASLSPELLLAGLNRKEKRSSPFIFPFR